MKFMLMLKADAYGHGLSEVAKATCDIVDGFGVFSLEEGLKTRKIAPKTPVLVNMLDADEIETAIKNKLIIGLSNDLQLSKIEQLTRQNTRQNDINIHLKVDSGMHRLGFDVDALDEVCKRLNGIGVELKGIYSHFGDHYCAQTERFDKACQIVAKYFKNFTRHIASSHTAFQRGLYYDGVRIGLAAYFGAMRVESEVVASRCVQSGEYVGYGDHFMPKSTNIATIFGGYADGIDREKFRFVWRDGKQYRVISVCMDSTIIDTGDDNLKIGDKVLLLDETKLNITAQEMNTIPYTLMTAWRGRISKIYC